VIFARQGLATWKPRVFRGIDNMTLASHVAHEIETWNPDAVFIDEGNGSGVIDRLRHLGVGQEVREVEQRAKEGLFDRPVERA
jgi:hypothetical protein